MKNIFSQMAKVVSFIFAAIVIAYTTYLTWLVAQLLVPDNVPAQVMTVLLFDFAALVWFSAFLFVAKGIWQWVFSGIGFLLSLAGTVIMAGAELVLGQKLVVLDNPEQLGWIVILTVISMCLVHVVLTYAFHFSDPDTINHIENMQVAAEHRAEALKEARALIPEKAKESARLIINSAQNEIMAEMTRGIVFQPARLPPSQPPAKPLEPIKVYAADAPLTTPVPQTPQQAPVELRPQVPTQSNKNNHNQNNHHRPNPTQGGGRK